MGKAKYLLAAKTNDGSQRPCAFFNLPQGCRKGDACPFLHTTEVIPLSNAKGTKDSTLSKKQSQKIESKEENQNVSNPFLTIPSASLFPGVNNKRKRNETDNSSDSDSNSSSSDDDSSSSSSDESRSNTTHKMKAEREISNKTNPINIGQHESTKPEKKKVKTRDSSSPEVEMLKKQLEQQAQTQQLLLQQLQTMQQNQIQQKNTFIDLNSKMEMDNTNKNSTESNNGNDITSNPNNSAQKLSQKQKRKLRKQRKMEQEMLTQQKDQSQPNQQDKQLLQNQNQSQEIQQTNANPFLNLRNEMNDRRDSSGSIISGINSTYSVDEILKNTRGKNVKADYAEKISALPSTPFMLESTQTLADISNKDHSLAKATSINEKPRRTSSSNLLAKSDLPFSPVPFDVAKPTKVTPEPKTKASNSQQIQQTQDSVTQQLTNNTKSEPQVLVERVKLPEGASRWLKCIQKTQEHSKYESRYANLNNGIVGVNGWVQAKKCGDWCKGLPHSLAIDCEMCSTKDPVSGNKDDKALLRISVVNGNNIEDVILDSLVMPTMPIDEYRTHIHGISPSHMENVTFTLRHAQAALRQICCDKTVLIGHAIINDLQALKFYHPLVIDTSFLYRRETESPDIWKPASLAACVASVLPKEERLKLSHDSVTDAQMTQRIAERYLNFGPSDPIPNKEDWKAKLAESKRFLLAHRIPEVIEREHIEGLISAQAQMNPLKVHDISFNGAAKFGRCLIEFTSEEAAENAFQALNGTMKPDKDGRKQKKISYGATERKGAPNNNYIFIRLNYYEKAKENKNSDNTIVDEVTNTNMRTEDKVNPFMAVQSMANQSTVNNQKTLPLSLNVSTSVPQANTTNIPIRDGGNSKGKTKRIVQYF